MNKLSWLFFVFLQVMGRLFDLSLESLHLESFEILVLVFAEMQDSLRTEIISYLDQRNHLLDKFLENYVMFATNLALLHTFA